MKHLIATACLLFLACGGDSAEDTEREPILLGTPAAGEDTLRMHLASLQRQFIDAQVRSDSSTLAQMIGQDFTVHDTRSAQTPSPSVRQSAQPGRYHYLAVLAGGYEVGLDSTYARFLVLPGSKAAIIYAEGDTHALRTTWQHRSGRWYASQVMILPPGAIQRALDRNQRP